MKNRVSIGLMLCVVTALVVCTGLSQALAADFTADFTEIQGDYRRSGKIYVKGSSYSMEMIDDDQQILVIVNPEAEKTIVIPMADGEYRELAIDDMLSIMNDPFQGFLYTAEMGELKPAGTETVGGYECDKSVIVMSDQDIMSRWVAKSLGFPIKIVGHGPPDKIMELTNVVEGPVDDSKFQIPEGFTKWIDPETLPVEPPAWASEIEAAPVMVPPFEKALTAGDIVRIKPEPGKSLAIKGAGTDATARVIPFKDGRPLKKDSWYNNLVGARDYRHETSIEVDEFVLYVYEGDVTVTSKWLKMQEKRLATGEQLRLPLPTWDNIAIRRVNLNDGESVGVATYFKDGVEVSEDEIGPAKYRTVTLKKKGDVDANSMSQKGDELVFAVTKGAMLVKMGQFDTFEF